MPWVQVGQPESGRHGGCHAFSIWIPYKVRPDSEGTRSRGTSELGLAAVKRQLGTLFRPGAAGRPRTSHVVLSAQGEKAGGAATRLAQVGVRGRCQGALHGAPSCSQCPAHRAHAVQTLPMCLPFPVCLPFPAGPAQAQAQAQAAASSKASGPWQQLGRGSRERLQQGQGQGRAAASGPLVEPASSQCSFTWIWVR